MTELLDPLQQINYQESQTDNQKNGPQQTIAMKAKIKELESIVRLLVK